MRKKFRTKIEPQKSQTKVIIRKVQIQYKFSASLKTLLTSKIRKFQGTFIFSDKIKKFFVEIFHLHAKNCQKLKSKFFYNFLGKFTFRNWQIRLSRGMVDYIIVWSMTMIFRWFFRTTACCVSKTLFLYLKKYFIKKEG